MKTSSVFTNDMLELGEKEFYYSRRMVNGPFDVFKTHAHNRYELYFLLSGKRNYFIKNKIVRVSRGDIILIPPHTIHKTTSVSRYGHERLLLNFTENFIEDSIREPVLSLFRDYCISVPEDCIGRITAVFDRIANEYENSAKHCEVMLKNLLTEIFIILLRTGEQTLKPNTLPSKTELKIKRVLNMLEDNISADITVDYAAQTATLSKSHFEKAFRELTGYTFIDYLNTRRLLKAQKLLIKTSKSVTEIAFECGFNSSNYFATVFKKQIGITPLKFRRLKSN